MSLDRSKSGELGNWRTMEIEDGSEERKSRSMDLRLCFQCRTRSRKTIKRKQRTQDKRRKPSSTPKPFAYRILQKYLSAIMTVANPATTASECMSSSLLFVPMMGGNSKTGGAPPAPPLAPPSAGGPASAIVRICLVWSWAFYNTHKHTHANNRPAGR